MRPESQRQNVRKLCQRHACGWLAVLVTIAAVCAANLPEAAIAEGPSPDQVEAAYLYNFGKFVRWPVSTAHDPLTICIANQNGMRRMAARLVQGEQIGGRALQVRSLDSSAGAGTCSILFIGGVQRELLDEYLSASAGKPVLTVGDAPDFLERGGIIQFALAQNHVRFSVNLNAARRNHLQLSSELLKVAIQVTGQSAAGGLQ